MILKDENGEEKKYQDWVGNLIADLCFSGMTTKELAEKYNRSVDTIYKYKEDERVILEIAREKDEYLQKYKDKLLNLVEKSMDASRSTRIPSESNSHPERMIKISINAAPI